MTPSLKTTAEQNSAVRLTGLDAARALALFGMIIVNVDVTAHPQGIEELVVRLFHGRASILFIVLAGIGFTFLARSKKVTSGGIWPTVTWRSALLLALGLSLQLLPTAVNVILALYAGLFLIGGLVVRWSSRSLLTGAAMFLLLGPVVYILLRSNTDLPTTSASFGQSPMEAAASVLLTGPYPLIVWAAPFMFGMWIGRLKLHLPSTAWRLLSWGLVAAGAGILASRTLMWGLGEPNITEIGFDHLVLSAGHSEMPLWLISSTGSAIAVIGLMLIITPRLGAFAHPLVITGQLALTCYALHLVAIAVIVRPESPDPNPSILISLLIIIGLILLSLTWGALKLRGPLETLLRIPSIFTRR
ncbi:DUF1624 domain-containing protein [Nesterenkonia sp. MY13]|uniref:DUF1624 domain-containing protein n=1 Tax=Nesterenkonia sedimenti TaxID=1463632 RepID=A0A7X8TIT5_9MICC|nr:heparan-alpha-glucosaminide N-acetyltransferase domain-containing protein [Nesterenkonia sedimenti]NLS09560.1 DUF1624 domain-containing protein [Nesterenkonia sedimenti]